MYKKTKTLLKNKLMATYFILTNKDVKSTFITLGIDESVSESITEDNNNVSAKLV